MTRVTVIPTRREGDRLDYIRHEPGVLGPVPGHARLGELADSPELALAVAQARPTVLTMLGDTVEALHVADAQTAALLRADGARLDAASIADWIVSHELDAGWPS